MGADPYRDSRGWNKKMDGQQAVHGSTFAAQVYLRASINSSTISTLSPRVEAVAT